MPHLNDQDCPQSIREYVRTNPDIIVNEYIKRGNNGEVYFGQRNKMGDDVVLKFYWTLNPKFDESEEVIILKNIKHQNILEVLDAKYIGSNFAYFLTPKKNGGDLQGIIDSNPITTKQALEIVAGILLGLTELHSKHNIVHRDLKPGNILISLDGFKPVIADLGAVKKIDKANGYTTTSKSTYYYLPPESLLHDRYYFQSDIYQVGIILFQLLRGNFPINNPNEWLTPRELSKMNKLTDEGKKIVLLDDLISKKIREGKIAELSTLPFYIGKKFKNVIGKAIHKNHRDRFENPAAFLKEIHKLQREFPEYIIEEDRLLAIHEDGKQYQIYKI